MVSGGPVGIAAHRCALEWRLGCGARTASAGRAGSCSPAAAERRDPAMRLVVGGLERCTSGPVS